MARGGSGTGPPGSSPPSPWGPRGRSSGARSGSLVQQLRRRTPACCSIVPADAPEVGQHRRLGSVPDRLLELGLGRGQAGDRHPVGRAGHVVEARVVEEADGGRVAAVLAADADLQARLRRRGPSARRSRPAARRRAASSETNGSLSRRPCSMVVPQELARRRRGERPKPICVRSLVPKEKNSASLRDLVRGERPARDLDHGADQVLDARRRPCPAPPRPPRARSSSGAAAPRRGRRAGS